MSDIRLNKLVKKYNIGLQDLVNFLNKQGVEVELNPNAKVEEAPELLAALTKTSGKDLQERGLSGTVCADNSIAITLAEREVDIFEKHAASILQTNIRNIEHGAKDSNYSERLIIQASRMRHISSGE